MRNPDFTLVSSRFPASRLLPAQESDDTTKGVAVPGWRPAVDAAKLMLTTAGSLLVIVLLAAPSARTFFRARQRG
jgi:hypothetical protein